jgi:histone H3/H4
MTCYGKEGKFSTSQKLFKFAWSPVRKLMKDNGAEMVARDAVDALIDYLEKQAKGVTNKALEMTRHAGRKKFLSN